nr:spidroin-2-like [Aegilops tauschii subsp. strangulata]
MWSKRNNPASGAASGDGTGDEEVSGEAAGDDAVVTGEDEADPGEAAPGETIDWVGESVVSRPTKARQPGPGKIAGSGEAGPGEITGSGEAGAGETSPGKASPGETGPASEEAGTGRARAEEPGPDAEEPGPGVHGACTRPLPTSGAVDGSGSSSNSRRAPRPVPAA